MLLGGGGAAEGLSVCYAPPSHAPLARWDARRASSCGYGRTGCSARRSYCTARYSRARRSSPSCVAPPLCRSSSPSTPRTPSPSPLTLRTSSPVSTSCRMAGRRRPGELALRLWREDGRHHVRSHPTLAAPHVSRAPARSLRDDDRRQHRRRPQLLSDRPAAHLRATPVDRRPYAACRAGTRRDTAPRAWSSLCVPPEAMDCMIGGLVIPANKSLCGRNSSSSSGGGGGGGIGNANPDDGSSGSDRRWLETWPTAPEAPPPVWAEGTLSCITPSLNATNNATTGGAASLVAARPLRGWGRDGPG